MSTAHVITVSDGVAGGAREDKSGPALVDVLSQGAFDVSGPEVVPDEVDRITAAVMAAVERQVDVIVTTGGTGLGQRDVTPQAVAALFDYTVPGIGEMMRSAGAATTPMAAISRSGAGVRGRTLIISVPGSARGATESLDAIMPVLAHAVQLLHGDTTHR